MILRIGGGNAEYLERELNTSRHIPKASPELRPQAVVRRIMPALNLPGEITRTAWVLPKDLSLDDWLRCGQALQEVDASVQFWIGDWWAYGTHAYGERAKAAAEGLLGERAFSTLMDYGSVARNVETSLRNEVVSFNHHRAVAPLEPADQKRWLDRAAKDDLSVSDLRIAIAREKATSRTIQVDFDAKALGRYSVLYADPPWRYESPTLGSPNRAIENHYPTMTLDEICALPVDDIAHDDAMLFMWATAPKLAESFEVIRAWGFTYRTCMVWVKDKIGMGYYARGRHELLLVGRRGELNAPQPENRPDSVFEEAVIGEPRTEHSVKPAKVREIIEKMYPGLRCIELFARGVIPPGWSTWGNQAGAVQ